MLVFFHKYSDPFGSTKVCLVNRMWTNQIVEVLADLPDDSGEGRPEQLLHVVRPRAVPVVRLQVVNPLKMRKGLKRKYLNRSRSTANTKMTF